MKENGGGATGNKRRGVPCPLGMMRFMITRVANRASFCRSFGEQNPLTLVVGFS